jgi:hypothetical protein
LFVVYAIWGFICCIRYFAKPGHHTSLFYVAVLSADVIQRRIISEFVNTVSSPSAIRHTRGGFLTHLYQLKDIMTNSDCKYLTWAVYVLHILLTKGYMYLIFSPLIFIFLSIYVYWMTMTLKQCKLSSVFQFHSCQGINYISIVNNNKVTLFRENISVFVHHKEHNNMSFGLISKYFNNESTYSYHGALKG